jgi:hypothetical protein
METVYALLIEAEADQGNEYPEGERRPVLVLVPARSPEEACSQAVIALADKRWKHGQVQQIERFAVPLASVEDPVMREAAEKAFSGNRAIIVYERV